MTVLCVGRERVGVKIKKSAGRQERMEKIYFFILDDYFITEEQYNTPYMRI